MWVVRWLVVTVSVVFLTTVGINAFDNANAPGRSLLGAVYSALAPEPCPPEMALIHLSDKLICVDRYENSANDRCPNRDPENKRQSDENLTFQTCLAESVKNATPWRNVSRQQAELACARTGKRLPTNSEWYTAALGTPDKSGEWGQEDCNVNSRFEEGPSKTGSRPLCVSPAGTFDMIGNVWEWMKETVNEGEYASVDLPASGYINDIDDQGIALVTNGLIPDASFFEDYFWLTDSSVRGMIRGGYWKSKTDAGQYSVNVTIPPSFVGTAVGFRCVKDVE